MANPCRLTRTAPVLVAAAMFVAVSGCRQSKPSAPESQPMPAPVPATQTQPSLPPPETQPVAQTQPTERPRHFEISELGAIKSDRKLSADQPLAILVKVDSQRPATLRARLVSDSLLTIDTDNVQALRLDLLNLPREQVGRLVLHIDGQGIEITGKKNPILYLQRSPVGEWSFGRPASPPAGPR